MQVQKIKAGTKSLCFCLPSSWRLLTKLTMSRSITQSGEHPWVRADSVAQAFIKPQQPAGYKNAYNSTHNHESPGLASLFALGNVHYTTPRSYFGTVLQSRFTRPKGTTGYNASELPITRKQPCHNTTLLQQYDSHIMLILKQRSYYDFHSSSLETSSHHIHAW